jgi:hypothetical protein
MKKIFLAFSISISLLTFQTVASGQGLKEMIIKQNNPGLSVDLAVGLWAVPLPMDYDRDGRMDLVISCPDTPYKGIYFFKNIGTTSAPYFAPAVRLTDKANGNLKVSFVNGLPRILSPEYEYKDFSKVFLDQKMKINVQGTFPWLSYKKSRSNMWSYVDYDGDGDQDIIAGVDSWYQYGWDNAYDSEGFWTKGPLRGFVHLIENVDGKYIFRGPLKNGENDIETYGAPNPSLMDYDGDGDLDLICGNFMDNLMWYRNIGTRTEPLYAGPKVLGNENGYIRFHVQMIVPVGVDFNQDGKPDVIVGDEDGRVAWIENTGKVFQNGMPIFKDPVYFQQQSDDLKFGALATPVNVDWDGDGLDDLMVGNSAGNIAWIRNLGGSGANGACKEGESPKWAAPELIRVDGKPFRMMAGSNGSIQGPCESKWGYTVLNVADWDNDGKKDIIFNSIWGKVQWLRNLGTKENLDFAPAQNVLVDWKKSDGIPKPSWNWWKPEPNTLVTQWRTSPIVIDWNKDGILDIISLDHEGYLSFYQGFNRKKEHWLNPGQRIFYCENLSKQDNKCTVLDSAPGLMQMNAAEAGASGRRKICFMDWDGDGDLDLIANSKNAEWYENVGKKGKETHFVHRGNLSSVKLAGHSTCPTSVDWNKDGIFDILLGAEDGHFYWIKNTRK